MDRLPTIGQFLKNTRGICLWRRSAVPLLHGRSVRNLTTVLPGRGGFDTLHVCGCTLTVRVCCAGAGLKPAPT
jgi:hypothetical protein